MCSLRHVIVHSLRMLGNLRQQKISPAKRRVLKAERPRGSGGDSSDTGGDSTPGDTTPCDTAGDTSQSDLDVDSKDGIADSKVRDVMTTDVLCSYIVNVMSRLAHDVVSCVWDVNDMCAIEYCNIHVHVHVCEIYTIGVHFNASFVTCAQ